MDTLSIERRTFLARLRRDPAFFARHAGALSWAVYKKLQNRLRQGLSPKHRGAKEWPDWLNAERDMMRASRIGATTTGTLPLYPLSPLTYPKAAPKRPMAKTFSSDPEDYFADHRWRFLLESLLEGVVHWRKSFDEAMGWVESHSDKADTAWEPYSACERVSNLLVFLSTMPLEFREKNVISKSFTFLDDSMEWIYRHIEYYGSRGTNNHIVNNARALALAGVAMGNELAISTAMKIFRECLPLLILRDGFLRERSSHYQLIVLNWMLDAWRFIIAYKGVASEDAKYLRRYVERMASAANMLCMDNRLLAVVGDVSPDVTPAESLSRLSRLYPEFWPVMGESPRPFELRDGWFRISAGDDVILGNFPGGSYPPVFPNHGHCDLTSFVWLHGGEEILTDSGRYRYTGDAVSLLQKSALGHNLPVVNGFSPLSETLVGNGLWWPRPYASAVLEITECDSGIVLAHDGFARATPVQRHSRKIVPEKNGLFVVDSFDGQGDVEVAFCWHFGKNFDTFDKERMAATGTYGDVRLSFEGVRGLPSVEPISGRMPGSWISHVYGEMQPALGISLRWRARLPAVISTRFSLAICAE